VGMVAVVPAASADATLAALHGHEQDAWLLGVIEKGSDPAAGTAALVGAYAA